MADITVPRKNVDRQEGEILSFKQSNVKLVEGALLIINATGFAVNAADTASTIFAGVADETVDNSGGSAGDKQIKVRRNGVFTVKFGGTATQATVGKIVCAVDNQTVDLASVTTNDVIVGRCVEFLSAGVIRVDIDDRV